ncbi:unnamed protein product [Vitrella brassicaformis CCMP3155]|uniref:Uncharacterized protein n=1 Tax=Vitrella brassicaformis (strain CCMP3155) TaxID=1169540 RepID=A0A0G4F4Y2_VITBC|nr:unnamed protein product [Vitrella brassicaformis CCMP3155]|eukprot:CEM07524.1 unnamed protein product [Vitrella brassicaformis CCMP3155]
MSTLALSLPLHGRVTIMVLVMALVLVATGTAMRLRRAAFVPSLQPAPHVRQLWLPRESRRAQPKPPSTRLADFMSEKDIMDCTDQDRLASEEDATEERRRTLKAELLQLDKTLALIQRRRAAVVAEEDARRRAEIRASTPGAEGEVPEDFAFNYLFAATEGNVAALEDYLERDVVDIDKTKDWWGATALICAVMGGNIDAVRLLLDRGASMDLVNDSGSTAAILAARRGYDETLQLLADRGASLNIKDKWGDTALHEAARNGELDCLKVLIDKGTDANLTNFQGETAMDVASAMGHVLCETFLEPHTKSAEKHEFEDLPL